MNAILYVLKGGIQWRLMPNDFPPGQTVYDHFNRWNKRGAWERALNQVNARSRQKAGRAILPTYGIIDAESVKTQYDSGERSIDDGKKVKGHKRHIVVDILGNLPYVKVHAANLGDTKSACGVLEEVRDKYPSLPACWVHTSFLVKYPYILFTVSFK
ncbi:transposase [Methylomonas sp. MgM2]